MIECLFTAAIMQDISETNLFHRQQYQACLLTDTKRDI